MDDAILTSSAIHRVLELGGSWIIAAGAWFAVSAWIDRDARFVFGSSLPWSVFMAALGTAMLASAVLLGFAGQPVIVALLALVCGAYVRHRESHVPTPHRLLTRSRALSLSEAAMRRWRAQRGQATAEPSPNRADGDVTLLRHDGMAVAAPSRDNRQRRSARHARDIVVESLSARATCVHVEPRPGGRIKVRLRIDGSWKTSRHLDGSEGKALAHEFRTLAGLTRDARPQRGAGFKAAVAGRTVEFRGRCETTPYGIRLVFDVLDPGANNGRHDFRAGLDGTGLPRQSCESIRWLVKHPRGAIVVCGPSGSGKTTTAYAVVAEIDPLVHRVATVEDAIAGRLVHVAQSAIDVPGGPPAAHILSAMRPGEVDAILLDRIRDRDTADAALRAAGSSTVIATLEAEDAADALMKLLALGVEPRTLGSAVAGVIAQRLVRVLCDQCKIAYPAPRQFLRKLPGHDAGEVVIFKRSKAGCPSCHATGYRGRVPVHELLVMDEPLRGVLSGRPTLRRIRTQARLSGMRTLRESAIALVACGVTSVKEIVRVVP